MTGRVALYPGTFDPIHYGHIDIAQRAAALFDCLVIGVYDRPNKHLLFSTEERVTLVELALASTPNVEVHAYGNLTVDFAQTIGAQAIVRGLRVISDFEFEYQMALTNHQLAPKVETICLMTHVVHAFLSSSTLKELFMLGGDVTEMVPPSVLEALALKRSSLDLQGKSSPLRD